MGHKRLFLINHPDYARHILCDNQKNYRKGLGLSDAKPLLGEGLLTSEGDLWARQRRLLQAAYQGRQLEHYGRSMVDAAQAMLECWHEHAANDQEIDISQEMARLTISILGRTLFRDDLSDISEELRADLTILTRWAMARMAAVFKLPLSIPMPHNLQARRALVRLDRIVQKIVERHSRRGATGDGSLLSLLASENNESQQHPVSEKQIRDEVLTLLLAGHETTAATLTWTLYLLSQNPEAEARLHHELDEVLSGRRPAQSDLPCFRYEKMLIEETLRLYPPVWMLPRKAISDDQVGDYEIPANSDVLLSVYSLHRHPAFWERPEQFDPERFTPERIAGRPSCAYLPFGAGPRTCIGSRFGMMEVMLVLATIAQRYRLRLAPGTQVKPDPSLTLQPRFGLQMKLTER
jgi:cytochrome P450